MKTEVRSTLIAPKGICLMHEFSSAVHKATKKPTKSTRTGRGTSRRSRESGWWQGGDGAEIKRDKVRETESKWTHYVSISTGPQSELVSTNYIHVSVRPGFKMHQQPGGTFTLLVDTPYPSMAATPAAIAMHTHARTHARTHAHTLARVRIHPHAQTLCMHISHSHA